MKSSKSELQLGPRRRLHRTSFSNAVAALQNPVILQLAVHTFFHFPLIFRSRRNLCAGKPCASDVESGREGLVVEVL
ncbi:hypothetical protein U1Q18_029264 [Sarracenia purpurea var. burkii]